MKNGNPPPFSHASFLGRIGVCRRDLTPPAGIHSRLWGAAKHDTAEGIHRPLTATAITFQKQASDSPFVLIALDYGCWSNVDDEWFVRGGLIEALSLDPSRVIIALSHTHSGPTINREMAGQPGGHLIAPYLDRVRDTVIEAAWQAVTSASDATLSWSRGTCALAVNRDLTDPSGKDRKICGYNPEETADDTLLVGRITAGDGKILGTIVNYACHPTTLAWDNRLISPDFIGAMRETVESHTGGAPCLFLQGAPGEVSPREQYVGDPAIADAHGRQLGYSALATLEGMLPHKTQLEFDRVVESGAPLATWKRAPQTCSTILAVIRTEAELPLKRDIPTLDEIQKELDATTDRVQRERVNRKLQVRRVVGNGAVSRRPIWVWRLGDAFIVAQSDQAYTKLQMELRRQFPDNPIAVVNEVNGSCGYQPPEELYGRNIYQVWQTPFERGCLERALDASALAVRQLLAS